MEAKNEAEQCLRESEERFRIMTASAQDAIVMMDDEGRVTFWNEAAERIFGYSKQEAMGMVVHDLLAESSYREMYRQAFPEWRATGQGPAVNKTIELTALRKDGAEIPIELSLSSVRIKGRWNALAVTRDITERKRADAELRLSNQRLDLLADTAAQLLISNSPQEVIDSLCRKVLTFLDCQAFFNYLVDYDRQRLHLNACGGISEEDARKMEWLDYGVGLCGCSARDGCRLVVEDLQDTDDQYTALVRPFGIQAYACHPLIAQGQVLGTLSFCSRTRKSFKDDELSLMKAVADQVAIALDRERSAERITRSEQRFRALVETTSDWIWEVDENEVYTYAGPKIMEYLGYEPVEVIGMSHYDLMAPNEARNFKTRYRAISQQRKPFYTLEKKNLHKKGATVILETSGVPVFDKHGCFRGYRGIDRDITERKVLEQKFLYAQKMDAVGQLASGIAHEFNNIIMAIIGYGKLLLPRLERDPEGLKFITQLTALANRAATLTHDLLTFGRKEGANPTPVDLNDTIRKTESMLRWLIGHGIELKIELQVGVLPVLLVSGQIEQLLINLATNARDAMPDGGLLSVKTASVDRSDALPKECMESQTEEYALVSVSDTGMGMDEATREKIFDPFYTTKDVGKGTGLGLTMVYGIVRQHMGAITVDSKQGQGTTFRFYLPLIKAGTQ